MVVEGMSFLCQPHANIVYHNILVQHEFGQYLDLDTVCSILSIRIEYLCKDSKSASRTTIVKANVTKSQ